MYIHVYVLTQIIIVLFTRKEMTETFLEVKALKVVFGEMLSEKGPVLSFLSTWYTNLFVCNNSTCLTHLII